MSDTWKQWEGQVVANFGLGRYLGGSDHSAVFLTERVDNGQTNVQPGGQPQVAAIKLIPLISENAEIQLSRWRLATGLAHPHLLRTFEFGEWELGGVPLLYVVMECAEENLGQVLAERPLAVDEMREMLGPVVDVLAYLHKQGIVHGDIKPTNILANGDQLKLSSDALSRAGDSSDGRLRASAYNPPESSPGFIPMPRTMSTAGDAWLLGMTIVETLTQHLPAVQVSAQGYPLVPDTLPDPFLDIARHCLVPNPESRCMISEIAARLQDGSAPIADRSNPAHSSKAAPKPVAKNVAKSVANNVPDNVPGNIPNAVPNRFPNNVPNNVPNDLAKEVAKGVAKRQPNNVAKGVRPQVSRAQGGYGVWIGVGLVVAVILIGVSLLRHRPDSGAGTAQSSAAVEQPSVNAPTALQQPAPQTSGLSAAANSREAAAARPAPASAPVAHNAPTETSVAGKTSSAARETTSDPRVTTPEVSETKSEVVPPVNASADGAVIERVLPEVPARARDTIRGMVKVAVRVDVDPSGTVKNAEVESGGPSKYFSRLALQAAQRWKFTPSNAAGQNASNTWTLRFQFARSGVTATPEQARP